LFTPFDIGLECQLTGDMSSNAICKHREVKQTAF